MKQLEALIGALAKAGEPGGSRFMRVAEVAVKGFKELPKSPNVLKIAEYTAEASVKIAETIKVQE